jgi:hypothetical protein
MLNSMLKIFVGPVMGGFEPPPTPPPPREYATEGHAPEQFCSGQRYEKSVIRPNDCFLTLFVNHKSVTCLVDTGAVASCMSESLAKRLKLTPQPVAQNIKLISANKSPIESKGIVDVELSIQGLVVPFSFYVLASLAHHMVLGNDLLRASGAIIDCAQRCITLYDGLVCASLTTQQDRHSVLKLAQNVIIPPATEAIIISLFRHALGTKPVS